MFVGKPSYYRDVDNVDWAPSLNLDINYSARYQRRQRYNRNRGTTIFIHISSLKFKY